MSDFKRAVVGYDLHYPEHNKKAVSAMFEFIDDVKPDIFGFGGDQFNNAEISHHNRRKPIYKPRGSYDASTKGFDKEILRPLESILGDAERFWIVGNHDDWEREFVETHPELEGVIERTVSLNLAERGWEVIPLGRTKRLGHLNVIHGEVLTGIGNQAGAFPSRKAVDIYGDNVLAGHTHAPQSFSKISPVEQKNKHMGWIAPILGDINPIYIENRPTAWINGFVVIEFHGEFFNLYPVNIFNGEFAYGGKIYGNRKGAGRPTARARGSANQKHHSTKRRRRA